MANFSNLNISGPARITSFNIIEGKNWAQVLKSIILRTPKKVEKVVNDNLKEAVNTSKNEYLSGPYPSKLTSSIGWHNSTGNLKSSIGYIVNRKGNNIDAIFGSLSNLVYSNIHEYGGTIVARNAPFLQFVAYDGRFVRKKSVKMPARPYVWPALEKQLPKLESDLAKYGITFTNL